MKHLLLIIASLMSISAFAETATYVLTKERQFITPVWGVKRASFTVNNKVSIAIACSSNMAFSDTIKLGVWVDGKVDRKLHKSADISNYDDCVEDLRSTIRSLEEGKKVELKFGLTGATFTELE